MGRRKKLPQTDDLIITGVVTRQGRIVRVCFGNTIINLSDVDDKTAQKLTRRARAWMRPPVGSTPITGHNKPHKRDPFDKQEHYRDVDEDVSAMFRQYL